MYERLKYLYETGKINSIQLQVAVDVKHWITQEEKELIEEGDAIEKAN